MSLDIGLSLFGMKNEVCLNLNSVGAWKKDCFPVMEKWGVTWKHPFFYFPSWLDCYSQRMHAFILAQEESLLFVVIISPFIL